MGYPVADKIEKYGLSHQSELQIEMHCIRKGGQWEQGGIKYGMGLAHHYEQMRRILWPHLDSHRWHNLCLKEIRRKNAKVTVLMGPGSSGKTHEAAWNYLCEYYCFPNETCVLVSSTDIRGLELRVWGEIKMLHEMAKHSYDWLPGNLIDSKHCIATDDVEESAARDLRRGIIGIPTVQGGKQIGLGKWVGIKQKRMRLVADESQFMGAGFLSAFANLDKNVDFQAIVLGNPIDVLDPLGRAAEPIDGWTEHLEPTKTEVWDTRFMNGRCVNLVGTDSPNFDFPSNEPTRYKYLISREKIANTLSFFPKDSLEYYSQCVGTMKIGMLARRVITRDLCKKFGALEDVVWDGEFPITRIAGLDSAYDGDRCVLTEIEMGRTMEGKHVLRVLAPVIVPVTVRSDLIPEDQISEFCKSYCERRNIPPENFGHDSTGRGSLGTSLARVWSAKCQPVEFGGVPTKRPVSLDLFVEDLDTGTKRLKRCDEHFSRWVSEAWWVVRMAIESGQLKNLPEETMDEGCLREFNLVKGNRIEVESKRIMKERIGRSPDLFDSLAIAVEICRRKGFQISKLAVEKSSNGRPKPSWLEKHLEALQKMEADKELQSM